MIDNKSYPGITMWNFGEDNFSHGMEKVTFNPREITWQEVHELPGIFLHPAKKADSHEIFALKGTEDQFNKLYESCRVGSASLRVFNEIGFEGDTKEDIQKTRALLDRYEREFIAWYEWEQRKIDAEVASAEVAESLEQS